MAERPIGVGPDGMMELIVVPVDADAEETKRLELETLRRKQVIKRREYVDGSQYDELNRNVRDLCRNEDGSPLQAWQELPEHEKKLAYSTHVDEAVTFIADQISDGFRVETEVEQVRSVIETMIQNTDALYGGDEELDITCDDVLRDALVAQDVPYFMDWNPLEGAPVPQFWPSEDVDFDVPYGSYVRKVTLQQKKWITNDQGQRQEVTERSVYDVTMRAPRVDEAGAPLESFEPHMECRKRTFWNAEDIVRSTEWLGLPFIPWGRLRGYSRNMRGFRGDSIISDQALSMTDRYNSTEQLSYIIARYNSHGRLAVVGDGASVRIESGQKVLHGDVGDTETFPTGTSLVQLSLPTDPQMIEHQKNVLSDALFKIFGLTRVEPETLNGLGGVSGYALEILNRKTEGTFKRIRRIWKKDMLTMLNMALDVYAYRQEAQLDLTALEQFGYTEDDLLNPDLQLPEFVLPMPAFWNVDPMQVFPDRTMEIRMGSGYIVDDVQVRDDFTAQLVSRREALRQRGMTDDDIQDMLDEEQKDKPEPPEGGLLGGIQTNGQVPVGTQAGGTLGSTVRE